MRSSGAQRAMSALLNTTTLLSLRPAAMWDTPVSLQSKSLAFRIKAAMAPIEMGAAASSGVWCMWAATSAVRSASWPILSTPP
jgi:hypothetical protein